MSINIRIRLFAHMAQQAGTSTFFLDLPDFSRLDSIPPLLQTKFPTLRWQNGVMLAVNQQYAAPDTVLKNHDEVAIIPPVSGGSPAAPEQPLPRSSPFTIDH